MIIETADISDAGKILELQKLAYMDEAMLYSNFDIQPMTETLEDVCSEFSNQLFLKGVEDNLIIGSVRGMEQDGACLIGRLIVHPNHRGKGFGSLLLEAIENSFPQCGRFELFTGARSERNLNLYRKHGYSAFKTLPAAHGLELIYLEKIV